ncbi:hypothetical protein ACHAXH_003673 [Discostella pseudostelligera]
MNDNQNYFVTRSTSRVLSEPGGKSSTGFLFGGGGGGSSSSSTHQHQPPMTSSATATATSFVNAVNTPSSTASPIRKAVSTSTTTSPAPKSSSTNMTPTNLDETAISAAARIKQKNEAQTFSLFGGGTSSSSSTSHHVKDAPPLSSNAYASSSTTNSYNVLTDRPTSRVLRPSGGQSSILKLG